MTVARVSDVLGLVRRPGAIAVDPLIKEARDRQWRRRRRLVGVVALAVVVSAVACREWRPGGGGGTGAVPVMSSQGIGSVQLGEPEGQAVAQLTRMFGPPTARFINTGCSSRFREVAWQHLYVEFRSGQLTGYRYIENGWPAKRYGTLPSAQPKLATADGVTLGASLGNLRHTYGRLRFVGTDRWQSANGLIFYDNAQHDPEPASSTIIEIKFGTCGDF